MSVYQDTQKYFGKIWYATFIIYTVETHKSLRFFGDFLWFSKKSPIGDFEEMILNRYGFFVYFL